VLSAAEAGIDRKMLESYDRPIVTDPHFFPDKKNSLIGEFENYLKILKSVSGGTGRGRGPRGARVRAPLTADDGAACMHHAAFAAAAHRRRPGCTLPPRAACPRPVDVTG
jgi:hypothetical protein